MVERRTRRDLSTTYLFDDSHDVKSWDRMVRMLVVVVQQQ